MEEDKAAAYYEELTRKGEGAARFKQGLGFSSAQSSDTIAKGSALASSSSFLSSFVRASSPNKSSEIDKQVQLEKIQSKLKKKSSSEKESLSRVSHSRKEGRERSRKSRSRSSDRYDRDRDRDRGRSERRRRSSRRSRSRSYSDEDRRRRRNSRERPRRSRSSPSGDRRLEKRRDEGKINKERTRGDVDYSRLIKGYAEMTPSERVKAKMKLQLSQTADKDTDKGMGAGWERFDFNKDAPLDDEEIEAAEDDAMVVKKMGQSFRFSALEARREEQIKAAHDQAIFGAPIAQPSISAEKESTLVDGRMDHDDGNKGITENNGHSSNLISDKVLAKQQGSWRDRARRLKEG